VRSRFLDAHCHLDECPDPADVARRAAEANIIVVAVTESPARFLRMKSRFSGNSSLRLAIGLHPMALPALGQPAVAQFLSVLPSTDYVGEVGLDFSTTDPGMRRQQVRVLDELLAAPSARSSLWSIHSRRADAEAIARLDAARVPAILHWFTGSKTMAERAATAGLYFSVNAAMINSGRGLSLIEAMPRERVLTETDAPYVARGRRDPTDVVGVVDRLAQMWHLDRDEAQDLVFGNMARVFAQREPRPAVGQP
jgi:TatD DNase family protein